MAVKLSKEEVDTVLSETDFSDLNTHLGGCTSVAVGIGRVIESDRILAPITEDEEIIHAFVELDGALFEADGLAYEDAENVVRVVHEYNPFESDRYEPKHFPMQSLIGKDDVDQYLLENFVEKYYSEKNIPYDEGLASEVASRLNESIEESL